MLGLLFFLAAFLFLVISIISFFRKGNYTKRYVLGFGICFVLSMVIPDNNRETVKSENLNTNTKIVISTTAPTIAATPVPTKAPTTTPTTAPTPKPQLAEIWTKENAINLLRKSDVLKGKAEFVDRKEGTKLEEPDAKTNIKNGYTMHLTIDIDNLDIDAMKQITFDISRKLTDTKRDFNIVEVIIVFLLKDGNENKDWENFYIGINTINNYFHDGKKSKNAHEYYKWIESHFTLPEDDNLILENESWTSTSKKSIIS